jgi:hypothetical protein
MVFLCVLLAALVSASQLRDPERSHESPNVIGPIVDLGYAQYQGSTNTSTDISSFLSIRYAAPPTGNPRLHLRLLQLTISLY